MQRIHPTSYANRDKRGFTLVEMLVATALFLSVVVISTGSFLSVTSGNRKAEQVQLALDNFNAMFEDMTRTIRTGYDYQCNGGTDCTGGTTLTLKDQNGKDVTYTYVPGGGSVYGKIQSDWWTKWGTGSYVHYANQDITNKDIDITEMTFTVNGADKGPDIAPHDIKQPTVLIHVVGTVNAGKVISDIDVQTMITQRMQDFN